MPQSRKRPGHPFQKRSDIPGKQRTNATTVCAILFGVFGAIIGFFAGADYVTLGLFALIGGVIGYFIGKAMVRDAKSS